jgi:hypothetical protein
MPSLATPMTPEDGMKEHATRVLEIGGSPEVIAPATCSD